MNAYHQWLGYAFERYCRQQAHVIAKLLGFSGVSYQAGAYYSRAAEKQDRGFQIDLVFDRKDHVMTVCEIKYTQSPVGTSVIQEFEKKCEQLDLQGKTLQKVLISAEGIDEALRQRHYFDVVITLEELFSV